MARIAMPVADGFEDSEFRVPWERLRKAGHEVVVIGRSGASPGDVAKGKRGDVTAVVDAAADAVDADDFDALVIPGGRSPERLRHDPAVVALVRRLHERDRPIAAICHGPQLLVQADVVRGMTLTSWPAVRAELEGAGADWIDRELVEDRNLITSRRPEDLDAFCGAIEQRL